MFRLLLSSVVFGLWSSCSPSGIVIDASDVTAAIAANQATLSANQAVGQQFPKPVGSEAGLPLYGAFLLGTNVNSASVASCVAVMNGPTK